MQVSKISDTIQEFAGERFYLCGLYFQRKGKRLHREVWKYHRGEIPKGFHVHHKDGDRSNNQIENLLLVEKSEHLSMHMTPEEKERSRKSIYKAIQAAPAWHKSEEGRKWHSMRGKLNRIVAKPRVYHCSFCEKEFSTIYHYGEGRNHFCSNNCKAAYRRRRIKLESNKG